LGAGLIFKKEERNDAGDTSHVVHALTTAASLWLSAAVGIACGGELYFAASFGTAIMMLLLRFGPRGSEESDEDENDDAPPAEVTTGCKSPNYASISIAHPPFVDEGSETASLTLTTSQRKTYQEKKQMRKRQKAALGSMV
jgi:uncharacterized membrane protein YhiD involved in acid resistance